MHSATFAGTSARQSSEKAAATAWPTSSAEAARMSANFATFFQPGRIFRLLWGPSLMAILQCQDNNKKRLTMSNSYDSLGQSMGFRETPTIPVFIATLARRCRFAAKSPGIVCLRRKDGLMTYADEWKAISSRITGLMEA